MVYTHSKFETIFGKKDEEEKPLSTKEASKTSLVRFIFMIMKSAPGKCCQLHYLQKLVDSYKGTMSTSDRWILKLAHLYEEQAGISSLELLLNRWSKETDECDLLSLLSSEKMLRTVNEFDFSRNVESLISEDEPEFGADLTSMYDISFLLPFTIGLLEKVSEKQMDLLPLFLTNLIGLAFVATSSDCEGTRRAALQILTKAEYLLLVSEVKELSSMTLLMEAFRNAVSSEGSQTPRIPSVLAFFAAQSILILMKPESSMYPLVHRFILQRPIIDLQDLPMFYEMVYSSTDTNRRERIWIIRLLSHGISNSLDLKLYKRRHAVDILISLYDNPISDMQLKKIIFETVAKAVKNPTVALDLIQKNGLTSFLASCSLEINIHSSDQLDTFVGILHSTLDCIPPQAISVSKSITLLAGTLLIRVSEMILAQDLHAFNPENGHIFNKLLQVLSGRAVVLECSDLTRIVEASKRLEGGAADSLISFLGSVRSLNMKDRHFLSLAIEFLSISYQTTSSESLILWLIAIRLNSRDTSFETLSVLHKKEWNRFMVHLNLLLQLGRVRNSGGLVRACITLMAMMLRDSGLSSPLTEDQFAKVESPRGILASSTTLLGDETDEVIFSLLRTRLFV